MEKYLRQKRLRIASDQFTFDSNVYDVPNETNELPPDTVLRTRWAVMVDMHN